MLSQDTEAQYVSCIMVLFCVEMLDLQSVIEMYSSESNRPIYIPFSLQNPTVSHG